MEVASAEESGKKCPCGAEFEVIMAACYRVNCPLCGTMLKVGACD